MYYRIKNAGINASALQTRMSEALAFGCWRAEKKLEVGRRETVHSAIGTTEIADLKFIPGDLG